MNVEVNNLNINNIKGLDYKLSLDYSTVITGWSGSGKSSFTNCLYSEAKRKFCLLLPKSEYSFIFKAHEFISTNNGFSFSDTPFIVNIENRVTSNTPRSTIGTFTSIFRSIRDKFATEHNQSSEFFSFNIPISWCPECKGKGTYRGVICNGCDGTRYAESIKKFKISCGQYGDLNIINILSLQIDKIVELSNSLALSKKDIIKLNNLIKLNIGYLSLGRSIMTLSGGEYARLIISNYLGLSEGIVYIIDEPSIGLDSQNIKNMISVLDELGLQNQIFIIDHNNIMRNATDYRVIFGEKSGKDGGKIVEALQIQECSKFAKIETNVFIKLTNLKNRNIDLDSLEIPLNVYSVITGESGVGKSSLVEAVIENIDKEPSCEAFYIEQNKSKSITSKSTIATYLGFLDTLKNYAGIKIDTCRTCNGTGVDIDNINCIDCNATGYNPIFLQKRINNQTVEAILSQPLSEIIDGLPSELSIDALELMINLSSGYLALDRKVNTLSGGEFQRLYLVKMLSSIFASKSNNRYIIFLDEPSRGLSQNYINDLLSLLKSSINRHNNLSFVTIEHNECMISSADYIMDMGKRRDTIDKLSFKKNSTNLISDSNDKNSFSSSLKGVQREITFKESKKQYKNLLKIYSKTAEWIYSAVNNKESLSPVIAIDFENDNLYSQNTRVYEILNIYVKVLQKVEDKRAIFNLTDQSNICKICKGSSTLDSLDFDKIFADKSKALFTGLVNDNIIEIIKPYNLTKIKFLLKEIKKEYGLSLDKPYEKMSEEERTTLKYGFLNKSFIFKANDKTTNQTWRGLNHLINKYLRTYKKSVELKNSLKADIKTIECPKCKGEFFNHSEDTLIDNISLREYIKGDALAIIKELMDSGLFEIYQKTIPSLMLNQDVSLLDRKTQVYLKLIEIANYSLQGYNIHIKNISEYMDKSDDILKVLEFKNYLYLHDDFSIASSKGELLSSIKKNSKHKLTTSSCVYEVFGINAKEFNRSIAALKKSNPCKHCKGKGFFVIENPIDQLDIETIECSICHGIGVDDTAIKSTKIANLTLHHILYGEEILSIPLNAKLTTLDKEELNTLLESL